MHMVAISAHSRDEPSDISGLLVLLPTIAMGCMTPKEHWYYGAHGTPAGATSTHSSDGPSNISEPLLLPPTIAMGYMTSGTVATVGHVARTRLLLVLTVATGRLTSADRCYYYPQ
jgi:hypothetical protein